MSANKYVVDWKGTAAAKVSLAAGASVDSPVLDFASPEKFVPGLAVLFGATPEANVRLEAFASPDESNVDTVAWATMELDYQASTIVQDELDINQAPRYLMLRITNLDPNDAVSVHSFYTVTRTRAYKGGRI